MIKIYSTSWCGPCASAKRMLNELNQKFEEIDIEKEGISREKLKELTDIKFNHLYLIFPLNLVKNPIVST